MPCDGSTRTAILARIDGDKSYDLAVDFHSGTPSWQAAGPWPSDDNNCLTITG